MPSDGGVGGRVHLLPPTPSSRLTEDSAHQVSKIQPGGRRQARARLLSEPSVDRLRRDHPHRQISKSWADVLLDMAFVLAAGSGREVLGLADVLVQVVIEEFAEVHLRLDHVLAVVDGRHHFVLFADRVPFRRGFQIDPLLHAREAAVHEPLDVGADVEARALSAGHVNLRILSSHLVFQA
ncbi:MAG TPA: hypothetical protein VMH80_29085 [Bryobacteraceae bacterium]|nr:hypothetical protein [Bryobacteraceae bacterium]